MPEILRSEEHSEQELLSRCAETLSRGGVVVLPTETVYGLAARVDLRESVARIFELKGRDASRALPVMVADAGRAAELVAPEWRRPLLRLAVFWPGPLTLVVRAGPLRWLEWVAPGSGEVGIRVPDHPFLLRLLRKTGPLAVTSANISGEAPPADPQDLDSRVVERVDLVLVQGGSGTGRPSTVARLSEEGVEILRPGDISREELEKALRPR